MADEKKTKGARVIKRIFVAAGVVVALAGAGGIYLTCTSLRATDVAKLSGEYPPIEDRSQRKATEGCGLNEVGPPPCKPAVVETTREEEVKFLSSLPEKGLRILKGTLTIPIGPPGPRPAVVLIHGSGPNARDEKAPGDLVTKLKTPFPVFAKLAEVFAKEGFVVLRYDKRNCGSCYPDWKADYSKFEWTDLESDAKDALTYLSERGEVDKKSLIVVGHSEGGQLAPFVAKEAPGVAAVVMLAGFTTTFDYALIEQFKRIEAIRAAQSDYFGFLAIREQRRIYEQCLGKLAGKFDAKDTCVGGGVNLGQLSTYIEREKTTMDVMRSLDVPLMVVQGSVDRNIDPAEMQLIANGMRGEDYELHYIPGMNHILMNAVSPSTPPSIDPELVRRMHLFFASVKR